jgi:hypothetical protein
MPTPERRSTPLSSCAASSSTCCQKASCASAISDCYPTASEPSVCPWRDCCGLSIKTTRSSNPSRKLPPATLHCGTARNAADPVRPEKTRSHGGSTHRDYRLPLRTNDLLHARLRTSASAAPRTCSAAPLHLLNSTYEPLLEFPSD